MTRVVTAPARSRLETRLARLDDLERSRAFHAGRVGLTLEATERLVARLDAWPWPPWGVHVAGSEGKTTTCHLIERGLRAAGLRTGLFTSPHLVDVHERVRVDGEPFGPDPASAAIAALEPAARAVRPRYFEYLLGLARVAFARAGVQAAVWETGLGGRLDATRVVPARVCAITSISLEHTAVLGPDLASIAREKAGIARPGVPLVVGPGVPDEAARVVTAHAAAVGAPVHRVGAPDATVAERNRALAARVLALLGGAGLPGLDAARVAQVLQVSDLAGRRRRAGDVLLDGAHTVAACAQLARELAAEPPGCLLFGTTSGRDAGAMLEPLLRRIPRVVLTGVPGGRGEDPRALAAALAGRRGLHVEVAGDPRAGLRQARRLAGGRGVLVTGSLHLMGALLA